MCQRKRIRMKKTGFTIYYHHLCVEGHCKLAVIKNNPAGENKLTTGLYRLYALGRLVMTVLKSKLKGAAIRHPCVQLVKLKLRAPHFDAATL